MRVLVSGAAGFVGHHFIEHVMTTTDWEVVALVSFRHRGDPLRLVADNRVSVVRCDLVSPSGTRVIGKLGQIDAIVNFASESSVDRSITDPRPFIENNVGVMLAMLEFARALQPKMLVQISTDEVYGPALLSEAHEPWAAIKPSNPYAASKAAQEAICFGFWRTYGVPVVLTNTMNMIGERQDPEKFLPTIIRNVRAKRPITVHGSPGHIGSRFYLHARNLASAIVHLIATYEAPLYPAADRPGRFHIVGEKEINNLELVEMVADIMDAPFMVEFEDFHKTRPGHDPRYALAPAFPPGWVQPVAFEESLGRTVRWTLAHPEWL
jgi:dTDP-glucose 4,6-dehydratase